MSKSNPARLAAILACCLGLVAAACGGDEVDRSSAGSAASAEFKPVTITSCTGFTSTIDAPPERVLITGHPEYMLLDRLGVADKVVGMAIPLQPVDIDQRLVDAMKDLPSVYSKEDPYGTPSAESMAAINADFMIAGFQSFFTAYDTQILPTQEQHEAKGVGTFMMTSSVCDGHKSPTIDDFYSDITVIGQVFGVEDKAAELVAELKGQAAAIAKKLDGVTERPTVYHAGYYGEDTWNQPIYMQGGGSQVDAMITQAGGTNIFADGPAEGGETSWEVVVERAPEVIIIGDFGKDIVTSKAYFDTGRDLLMAYEPAQSVPAVKDGKIFYVNADGLWGYNVFTLPSLLDMAKAIHPELFS